MKDKLKHWADELGHVAQQMMNAQRSASYHEAVRSMFGWSFRKVRGVILELNDELKREAEQAEQVEKPANPQPKPKTKPKKVKEKPTPPKEKQPFFDDPMPDLRIPESED